MIQIQIFRNEHTQIYGFCMKGHAGYAEEGSDIVCSAVSVLVINTINCIEKYTGVLAEVDYENDGGYISYCIPTLKKGISHHDIELLLKVMVYGLKDLHKQYGKYIQIKDREV